MAITVSGPLIKLALSYGAQPSVIAFYRLFLTGLLMLILTFTNKNRRQEFALLFRREARKDLLLTVLGGVLLAVHYLMWIPSLSLTSTFGSVVLVTTQPLFTIAGAYLFFRERTVRSALKGVALSMLGVVIIGLFDSSLLTHSKTGLLGDVLALAGAYFAAMYFLCGRVVRRRVSIEPYTGLLYLVSSVVLIVVAFVTNADLFPSDYRIWLTFLGLAFICTLFGHTMLNWALGYVKASFVSMALLGEPIGAAVFAYFFFGERVGPGTFLGGVLIIAGVLWFTTIEARALKNTALKEQAEGQIISN